MQVVRQERSLIIFVIEEKDILGSLGTNGCALKPLKQQQQQIVLICIWLKITITAVVIDNP
jgi:hypothetical protein